MCPVIPEAAPDREGLVCPFAGHIRKTYPRDDQFEGKNGAGLNESTTQTHRLLRRGIPFGETFNPELEQDSGDRGLLFLAYQTSIVEQFEFVSKFWVNNPNFKESGSGHDPILGQNNTPGENRQRQFKLTFKTNDGNERTETVTINADWVFLLAAVTSFLPQFRRYPAFVEAKPIVSYVGGCYSGRHISLPYL